MLTDSNEKVRRSLTDTQSHYKQHVHLWSTTTIVANEPPDDSHGDAPLLLPNPAGNIYGTAHDNETDKVIETIQPNQKILAMFRDKLATNRIETQKQINLLQIQMTLFQTIVTGLMTHLAQSPVIARTSADISPIL
jgi:hypothetical protein